MVVVDVVVVVVMVVVVVVVVLVVVVIVVMVDVVVVVVDVVIVHVHCSRLPFLSHDLLQHALDLLIFLVIFIKKLICIFAIDSLTIFS